MVVRISGVEREVTILDERALLLDRMGMSSADTKADLELCAPMPGKILSVLVKPGDYVNTGDSILILEAMKMENVIKASAAATVEEVPASAGSAVEKGELLVKFAE
jgi:biotin carboxyl carrier protein